VIGQMGGKRRGYTAVELLMSIAVLAIGVSGIIAMQKVAVASNRSSKNLAIATEIAQAWQEQLAADSVLWNYPSPQNPATDRNETEWLGTVGGGWFRPLPAVAPAQRPFGPAFDALGNPVTDSAALAQAHFCTHIRLSWLRPEGPDGNGLIRTEVRVFWLREGGGGHVVDAPVCSDTAAATVDAEPTRYHWVYLTSAVKQNPPNG